MTTLLTQARLNNPLSPRVTPTSQNQGVSIFSDFIVTIIGWLFLSGILVFVLFFFINAIKYIASSGDKQGIESARMGIIQGVVGLVVLFALWAILRVLENVFGVCLLQIPVPVLGETISGSCNGGVGAPVAPTP